MDSGARRARLLLAEFLANELGSDLDRWFLAATDKLLARLWLSGYSVGSTGSRPDRNEELMFAECLSEELGVDLDPGLVEMSVRLLFRLGNRGAGLLELPGAE